MSKKFEEEFPKFKGKKLEMTTAEYIGRLVTEVPFKLKEGYGPTIRLCKEEDVQKHCIDKQRVRVALNNLIRLLRHKQRQMKDLEKDYKEYEAFEHEVKIIRDNLGLEE